MTKNIYLILILLLASFTIKAQTVQPSTIGEVYNFEVGDTFVYLHTIRDNCGFPTSCIQTTEVVIAKNNNNSLVYDFHIYKLQDTVSLDCSSSSKYKSTDSTERREYTNLSAPCFSISADWRAVCSSKPDSCEHDSVVINSRFDNRKSNDVHGIYVISLSSQIEGLGDAYQYFFRDCRGILKELIYFHKVNEQPWSNGTAIINSIPDLPFQKISFYPTLVKDQFTVNLQGEVAAKEANLMLYDGLGRPVMNKVLTEDKTVLDSNGLGKGFYTWMVVYESRQVKNGKLIIQ